MKELALEFEGRGEVKGATFTQIAKTDFGYIYQRSDGYYEVFKRKIFKRFDCVSYPKSTSFGITAWCCSSLEKAYEYLKSFENDKKK